MGGGLLVGLPLLFTMEVWWHGFLLPSWKILALFVVGFAIVIGYTALTGFRRESTWTEVIIDSIESMGIAVVLAAVALIVLGRIEGGTSLRDAVGKIALEAIPIAFGASVASGQLSGSGDDAGDQGSPATKGREVGSFGRLLVAAGGALLFALNVAPTEEPMLLGVEAEWWRLLLAMVASYAVTLALVFYADFPGGRPSEPGDSPLDHPLTETLAAYAISLLVALGMLWAFGRTDGVALPAIIGQTVTLAIVASFGAAAGRLLIGGGSSSGSSSSASGAS
jgi:putative integral membrane protein (TIGR02587 family)